MTNDDFELLKIKLEKSLQWNHENMQIKLIELAKLYQTHCGILCSEKKEQMKLQIDLEEIYGELYKTYKFESTYRWDTKGEIESQIFADKKYINIKKLLNDKIVIVEYISQTIDNIKNVSYQIKSYMDWERFKAGI